MGQGVVVGTKENGLPVGKLFFATDGPPPKVWLIPGNPPDARLLNPNTDPPWTLDPNTKTWVPPASPANALNSIMQTATEVVDANGTAEKVGAAVGVLVFLGLLWKIFKSSPAAGGK